MKKGLLAVLLAGAMVFGTSAAVMAEEEYLELDYTMIDEDAYDGTWISAFGVFDLFLPTDWDVLVNWDMENEDEPENGVYFQAANEDQSQSVAISYAQTEGDDLETLADKLAENGFEDVAYAYINEIPVVTYSVTADGIQTAGIATIGDMGGMYNVTIGCAEGDDSFLPIASNILCSFSATEYEDEYETEE